MHAMRALRVVVAGGGTVLALTGVSTSAAAQPLVVTHLAGPVSGGPGYVDGPVSKAQFYYPVGIAVDAGGQVAVLDSGYVVRRIDGDGMVGTLAGAWQQPTFADGTGTAAHFGYPMGHGTFDPEGNLYLCSNARVRKVTPSGVVTTLAGDGTAAVRDGTGTAAAFKAPFGITYSAADGNLYVADEQTVRRVSLGGVVTTIAGAAGTSGSTDGDCASARFATPKGVAIDASGALYVANSGGHTIRKIALPACTVSTIAGVAGSAGSVDGDRTTARLSSPGAVVVDGSGSLYVSQSHMIRHVTQAGDVTTIAGTTTPGWADGTGTAASFYSPVGLALDPAGNILVADQNNHSIRRVTPEGVVTTFAGAPVSTGGTDGTGAAARFNSPRGLAIDHDDNVYVAEWGGHVIRKITPAGVVTTVAGAYGVAGSTDGPAASARFRYPQGVGVATDGTLYVADTGNNTIRKIATDGTVSTVAGLAGSEGSTNGTGSAARFRGPAAVVVDGSGNLFVADRYNTTIRRVTPAGVVTLYAGITQGDVIQAATDGPALSATFESPLALAFDADGNLLVVDYDASAIRKVTLAGQVVTIGGRRDVPTGIDGVSGVGTLRYPASFAVGADGSLYVADNNGRVRRVSTNGTISTVAGKGVTGHVDGYSALAQFGTLNGAVIDSRGRLVFSDGSTQAIRMLWRPAAARSDFDADARSDVGVYRPASGTWFSLDSSRANATFRFRGWGVQEQNDVPVAGDFDGDGIIDPTVFRPASGTWFTLESHADFTTWQWFGWGEATDTLVAGDYDGDGKTDAAIYRPSSGTWFVRPSSGASPWNVAFGQAGDEPVAGDFDGDGKRDPAVFRPSAGTWFWLESSTNLTTFQAKGWGVQAEGDVPAPGDYDGDGKTDPCVFRPSTGAWFILESRGGYTSWNYFGWGGVGDQLVPADYDGDGRTDGAVYRPTTGAWFIRPSSGVTPWNVVFGQSGDAPLVSTR
jgi:hypothetical protein